MRRISLKTLSVLLSFAMIISAFAAFGTISASAESYERVIINYDDLSRHNGLKRCEGSNTNTSSITTVDGLDNPSGKVLKLVLSNYMGFKIGLTEKWYEGKPIAIKFWARTESGTFSTVASQTGLVTSSENYAGSASGGLLSIFASNGGMLDSTGRFYTIDLSGFTLDQLKTFRYFGFKAQGMTGNVTAYFDDITLVYENESDAPAELEWHTRYDWETDTTGAVAKGNTFKSSTTAFTSIGSTKSLCVKGTWGNKTQYMYVDVSSGIENAKSLRAAVRYDKVQGNNPTRIGVEYNGTQYWKDFTNAQTSFAWFYFDFNTFKSSAGDSITLDDSNVCNVTKLLFCFTMGYEAYYVDDIQYAVEKSTGGIKASFVGADDSIADITTGGVFPDATVSGYTFIGWKDSNGNLYKAGSQITLTENTTFTAVAAKVETQEGAGVRWSNTDVKRGLKFTTYISGNVDAAELKNYISPALVKTVISGNSKTVDVMNSSTNDGNSEFAEESNDTTLVFHGSVTEYQSDTSMLTVDFTAQGVATVTYADGTTMELASSTTTTRNMKYVAQAAYDALKDETTELATSKCALLKDVYGVQ